MYFAETKVNTITFLNYIEKIFFLDQVAWNGFDLPIP